MKKLLFSAYLLCVSFFLTAQQVPPADQQAIDNFIKSISYTETQLVKQDVLRKVFTGNFYNVKPGFKEQNGTMTCSEFHFNILNGKLTELEELDQDKELTTLNGMLNKNFLIKDEASAKTFETALDALYPLSDSDKAQEKHLKKGNQWIYVRGPFFEKFKALLVTVDAKGAITKMEFSLNYTGK